MFVLLSAEAIDGYFDQILTLLEEVSQNWYYIFVLCAVNSLCLTWWIVCSLESTSRILCMVCTIVLWSHCSLSCLLWIVRLFFCIVPLHMRKVRCSPEQAYSSKSSRVETWNTWLQANQKILKFSTVCSGTLPFAAAVLACELALPLHPSKSSASPLLRLDREKYPNHIPCDLGKRKAFDVTADQISRHGPYRFVPRLVAHVAQNAQFESKLSNLGNQMCKSSQTSSSGHPTWIRAPFSTSGDSAPFASCTRVRFQNRATNAKARQVTTESMTFLAVSSSQKKQMPTNYQ